MYFVVIDTRQLYTRLRNSGSSHTVDLDDWLDRSGFVRTDGGWYGSADSMNCLSWSEILFSEWSRPYAMPAAAHAASGVRTAM